MKKLIITTALIAAITVVFLAHIQNQGSKAPELGYGLEIKGAGNGLIGQSK